jgi:hypothetical protein
MQGQIAIGWRGVGTCWKFFRTCMAVVGGDRDIDLYHWSTPRFSSVWQDTLSVLVARGRARVTALDTLRECLAP